MAAARNGAHADACAHGAPVARARASPEIPLRYRLLADGLVVLHLAFLAFAAFGGLLALRHLFLYTR